MTDFMRSMRIAELKSKAAYWTQEKFNAFYGNTVADLTNPVSIEPYANGYISVDNHAVEYVDINTGITYKLKKSISENDWACVTALYTKALANNIRMENPAHRTISSSFEYIELVPPSSEFGDSVHTLQVSANTEKEVIIQYFTDLITTMGQIFALAKEVAAEKKSGITLSIFNPQSYYKDSTGFYATGLDSNWTVKTSDALATALRYFDIAVRGPLLDEESIANLKEHARSQWI